jgi:hypothetical protein
MKHGLIMTLKLAVILAAHASSGPTPAAARLDDLLSPK